MDEFGTRPVTGRRNDDAAGAHQRLADKRGHSVGAFGRAWLTLSPGQRCSFHISRMSSKTKSTFNTASALRPASTPPAPQVCNK